MHKLSDEELVRKTKQKNIKAFEELIKRYEKKVYNLTQRMLPSEEDAKDALQEIFISTFNNIDKFEEKSSFSTWLYRIATNACLLRLKQRKIDEISIDSPNIKRMVNKENDIEKAIDIKELRKIIEQAIKSLPDSYRAVFVLKDIEGLSNQEIAKTLGISLAAAKARLHRARLMLREKISPYIT